MRTLIVGNGVIGVTYGWALTEAGIDVTHLVRPGKAGLLGEPVKLDVLDERDGHPEHGVGDYLIRCVESLSPHDDYELVIVPTSSFQTEAALQQLVPLSGDALFLVFAANWEGTEFIDRLLPRSRYLMGYPDGGGTRRDGLYWVNLGAEVHLGEVDGRPDENLQRVTTMFTQADMRPDVQPNIVHWLWVHNALALGLWPGITRHPDLASMLEDRALLREGFLSTRELLELCRRRGVNLRDYADARYMSWPMWLLIPVFRRLYRTNESMQRYTAHAADSLAEARHTHREMLETARTLGFEMPHTEALGAFLQRA